MSYELNHYTIPGEVKLLMDVDAGMTINPKEAVMKPVTFIAHPCSLPYNQSMIQITIGQETVYVRASSLVRAVNKVCY